jgi:hypothetical protein
MHALVSTSIIDIACTLGSESSCSLAVLGGPVMENKGTVTLFDPTALDASIEISQDV